MIAIMKQSNIVYPYSKETGIELNPINIKHKYNFKKTNWEKFNKTLQNVTNIIPN